MSLEKTKSEVEVEEMLFAEPDKPKGLDFLKNVFRKKFDLNSEKK